MDPICPQCHGLVRPTDFFCFNCGKNLQSKSLSVSLTTEIMCYVGSVFLPPLGYWWGIKYLKQPDTVSRRIAIVSMVLTTVSMIIMSVWTMNFVNEINAVVGNKINGLQGF